MGSYHFRWNQTADEVSVRGSFNNWDQSIPLKKANGGFEKQIDIPTTDKKIYYKFIVDGNWVTDPNMPTENDSSGNANNVLSPEDIDKIPAGGGSNSGPHDAPNTVGNILSGIGPGSSTLDRAGAVPLTKDLGSSSTSEAEGEDKMPGAFPEATPLNEGTYTPIDLFPGDMVPDYGTYFPPTRTTRSSGNDSSVARDPNEQSFGVNPIPASSGYGNPIKLEPGQPMPSSSDVTTNDLHSNVTTDKESYEKSGDAPFSSLGGAGAGLTGLAAAGAAGVAGLFGYGSTTKSSDTTIPESSLPMGDGTKDVEKDETPIIRSAAGQDTSSSALAGQVPLEPRGVPQIVQESQNSANVDPEASQSSEAVSEKRDLEEELKQKVPEEEPITGSRVVSPSDAASGVPQIVQTSQDKANVDPEASQSSEAVIEKTAMEDELKQKVPEEEPITGSRVVSPSDAASGVPQIVQTSQDKANVDPEASQSSEAVTEKTAMEDELRRTVLKEQPTSESTEAAAGVPQIVQQSQQAASVDPEAAQSEEAVTEKRDVEEELKQKVPEEQSISEDKGMIVGGATALGATALGGLAYASHKAGVPQSIQDKISSMNTTTSKPAEDVPRPVAESYQRSSQEPEAAANSEAISEKKDMEKELLQDVKTTNAAGEPAPTMTAAHITEAPGSGSGVVPPTDSMTNESSSSRITDPSTIPSTDLNPSIADADTMPAISLANGDALQPSEPTFGSQETTSFTRDTDDSSIPNTATTSSEAPATSGIFAPTTYESTSTVPSSSEAPVTSDASGTTDHSYGRDAALLGGTGIVGTAGAAAYLAYDSRQDVEGSSATNVASTSVVPPSSAVDSGLGSSTRETVAGSDITTPVKSSSDAADSTLAAGTTQNRTMPNPSSALPAGAFVDDTPNSVRSVNSGAAPSMGTTNTLQAGSQSSDNVHTSTDSDTPAAGAYSGLSSSTRDESSAASSTPLNQSTLVDRSVRTGQSPEAEYISQPPIQSTSETAGATGVNSGLNQSTLVDRSVSTGQSSEAGHISQPPIQSTSEMAGPTGGSSGWNQSTLVDRSVPKGGSLDSDFIAQPTTSTASSKPLAAPEDPSSRTSAPATDIAARVFGAGIVGGAGLGAGAMALSSSDHGSKTAAAEPTSSRTSALPVTSSTEATKSVSRGVFDQDPTSAVGTSAPAMTSTASTLDPRSVASAFANDPISATGESALQSRTVAAPVSSQATTTTLPGASSATTGTSTTGSSGMLGGGAAGLVGGGLAGAAMSSGTKSSATSGLNSSGLSSSARDQAKSAAVAAMGKENAAPAQSAPPTTTQKTAPVMTTPPKTTSSTGGLGSNFGGEGKQKVISRDVSPHTRGEAGPSTTTGVASSSAATKQIPSTPQKVGKTSTTGTPASATSGGTPASGTPKSEKRRSRLGTWFKEHVTERKSSSSKK